MTNKMQPYAQRTSCEQARKVKKVQFFLRWGIFGLRGYFLRRAPEKTARPQADGRLQGKTSLSPAQEHLDPPGMA